jgi:hypothetical protein
MIKKPGKRYIFLGTSRLKVDKGLKGELELREL